VAHTRSPHLSKIVSRAFVPERRLARTAHAASIPALDAAQCAEKGLLIRRGLDLMSALKLAVQIGLDEIHGDEFAPR